MKRYVWSIHSRVFHDLNHLSEACNTDDLKHRRESDEPPPRKLPCKHCGGAP